MTAKSTLRTKRTDLPGMRHPILLAPKARAAGDYETAAVYAGEAIDLIRAVELAGAIVGRVVTEAEEALTQRFT
ncbi:hypothetical protein [Paraburkholderia sediminicola]|uniref:hypothetical protein n=1 Tax=Paraburkholderia sediminicola TaxID=458836 RepID=UPI0038B9CD3A